MVSSKATFSPWKRKVLVFWFLVQNRCLFQWSLSLSLFFRRPPREKKGVVLQVNVFFLCSMGFCELCLSNWQFKLLFFASQDMVWWQWSHHAGRGHSCAEWSASFAEQHWLQVSQQGCLVLRKRIENESLRHHFCIRLMVDTKLVKTSKGLMAHLDNWGCEKSTYAYVRPHSPFNKNKRGRYIFYLCDLYMESSKSIQIETLTHEAHAVFVCEFALSICFDSHNFTRDTCLGRFVSITLSGIPVKTPFSKDTSTAAQPCPALLGFSPWDDVYRRLLHGWYNTKQLRYGLWKKSM